MKPSDNEMVRVRKKEASTQTDSGTDCFMNVLKLFVNVVYVTYQIMLKLIFQA